MHRLSLLLLAMTAVPAWAQGFKLAPGYEISEYADAALANDIIGLTIDPKGRVVVSGPNYIRILVDDQKAGKATRAIEFAREPKTGCHGLLWEGNTIYFVGDDGLRKLVDADGNDEADGPATLIRAVKAGVEHGAHALRRGPDGWLYMIVGDQGGINEAYAELPTSPIKRPIAGCVLRFHPTTFKSEIVAHGFRNPYGFDFDGLGRLLTFDSDNERCVGMPWYESNRLNMVIDGGFYGWLGSQFSTRLWRIPPYAPDVVAPLATFGRGSPTFVVAVGGAKGSPGPEVLLGDWTFGRIHRARLPADSLDVCKDTGVLLESTGGNGFAPTAAAVHPQTGDVFVAIGGRGTRGAVYRIRGGAPSIPVRGRPALAAEAAADPNAEVARGAVADDPLARLRALERVSRRQPGDKPALRDEVARAAIEANWENPNRVLAYAVARAASDNAGLLFKRDGGLRARRSNFLSRIMDGQAFSPSLALPLLECDSSELVLDGLCLLQRRLDLPAEPSAAWEGYAGEVSAEDRKTFTPVIVQLIDRVGPTNINLRREAARTFGLIASDQPATRAVAWLEGAQSPVEMFHLLAVLAHAGPRLANGETEVVARALIRLDREYGKSDVPRETNWPTRFGELVPMLLKRDPKLGPAIVAHPDFGAPEHALFGDVPGFPREKALAVFHQKIAADPHYALNGKVLALLADVPGDDVTARLRPHWGKSGLDEGILPFLARTPLAADRAKFVAGLKSLQSRTVEVCLNALAVLKMPADDEEVLNLFAAWDQAGDKQVKLVGALVGRLQEIAADPKPGADRAGWNAWLEQKRPAVAKRLALVDNVDRAAWQKRLDAVDWQKGDADQGGAFYVKASCAACHTGTQSSGPDLAGSANRFSRDDLFTALLQPNKEVADRYRVTQIVTTDGKVHRGVLIYNAFDGVLVRTGVADIVRIPGAAIETRATIARSLMPTGLLDAATDAELANLYAYLKSLGTNGKK